MECEKGPFHQKGENMQADKLDKEILDAFRQLSHEQKLSIIASLASALAEQEEASSGQQSTCEQNP